MSQCVHPCAVPSHIGLSFNLPSHIDMTRWVVFPASKIGRREPVRRMYIYMARSCCDRGRLYIWQESFATVIEFINAEDVIKRCSPHESVMSIFCVIPSHREFFEL